MISGESACEIAPQSQNSMTTCRMSGAICVLGVRSSERVCGLDDARGGVVPLGTAASQPAIGKKQPPQLM